MTDQTTPGVEDFSSLASLHAEADSVREPSIFARLNDSEVAGLRSLVGAGQGGTLLSKPVGTSLVSRGLAELLERATMKRAGLYRITPLGIAALDTTHD